jgi:hypothetical protein
MATRVLNGTARRVARHGQKWYVQLQLGLLVPRLRDKHHSGLPPRGDSDSDWQTAGGYMGRGDRTIPRSGSGETIRHDKHDLARVFIARRLRCLYCRLYEALYQKLWNCAIQATHWHSDGLR